MSDLTYEQAIEALHAMQVEAHGLRRDRLLLALLARGKPFKNEALEWEAKMLHCRVLDEPLSTEESL